MEQFNHIGLIGRKGSVSVIDTLKRLKRFLLSRNLHVVLEQSISQLLPGHGLQIASKQEMGAVCDLVIVVGGDGSMLGAARALSNSKTPVLGINRGNLGFLTDVQPAILEEQIAEVLSGRYVAENRFLLDVTVKRGDKMIGESRALNEMVLHPGKTTRVITFELFIDDQFVSSQRADGVIIATPTGSTAYALSGGGPIIHPRLNALLILPMFPHTLSSRPLVIDGESMLKIVVGQDNETWPTVSCDGQVNIATAPGDVICIKKQSSTFCLIHPLSYNYYAVCRTKLGWGSRLDQLHFF